jgi:hypothetical protein
MKITPTIQVLLVILGQQHCLLAAAAAAEVANQHRGLRHHARQHSQANAILAGLSASKSIGFAPAQLGMSLDPIESLAMQLARESQTKDDDDEDDGAEADGDDSSTGTASCHDMMGYIKDNLTQIFEPKMDLELQVLINRTDDHKQSIQKCSDDFASHQSANVSRKEALEAKLTALKHCREAENGMRTTLADWEPTSKISTGCDRLAAEETAGQNGNENTGCRFEESEDLDVLLVALETHWKNEWESWSEMNTSCATSKERDIESKAEFEVEQTDVENKKNECDQLQQDFERAKCADVTLDNSKCTLYNECHERTAGLYCGDRNALLKESLEEKQQYQKYKRILCIVNTSCSDLSPIKKEAALTWCSTLFFDTKHRDIGVFSVTPKADCENSKTLDTCSESFILDSYGSAESGPTRSLAAQCTQCAGA